MKTAILNGAQIFDREVDVFAEEFRNTHRGPIARILGRWYSVNGTEGLVTEIRFRIRPSDYAEWGIPADSQEWAIVYAPRSTPYPTYTADRHPRSGVHTVAGSDGKYYGTYPTAIEAAQDAERMNNRAKAEYMTECTRAAAPELLDALRLALSRAECELRMWPVRNEGSVEHQSLTTAANKFRSAIAKAEGRS